jgi:hypothetical protein
MMVFRNWFNEQHSKSTSKKVKAAKRVCAENGKYLGAYAPYGFMKDPGNRHRLIIDVNTAPVVRGIFEMRAGGMSFRAIAVKLSEEGVIPPKEYYYQNKNQRVPYVISRHWNESTVQDIIKNEAYIGNTVQGKSGTVSYKSRRLVSKPREEWIRSEATHEPLIERELWERAQHFTNKRYKQRRNKDGGKNLFTGLLRCGDCGFRLRARIDRGKRKDGGDYKYVSYMCGNYARSGKLACTIHTINENALSDLVIGNIRKHMRLAGLNTGRITDAIRSGRNSGAISYRAAYQSELEVHKKQIAKLDLLIENLYEDKVTGIVPEGMFIRQIQKYERERTERLQSSETLEQRIKSTQGDIHGASTFYRQYTEPETLDSEALLLLIDRITVGEAQVIDGRRVCGIQIVYNYSVP